ncbi:MAG: hypothetical protein E5X61_02555 [Mesorhizobium sp.]|nr:MAG: hypothetical protein E5X61_02555 [Mesorhizobium sp.]
MVGVGLIGTGFMGKCHAIAWNAVGTVFPDAAKPRLVHLGEVNEGLAKRRAGEFGFACLIPGHYDSGMKGDITVAH